MKRVLLALLLVMTAAPAMAAYPRGHAAPEKRHEMSLAQYHWNTRARDKVADPYWTPCDPEPISDNSCN
jgi:hypothetical protein